MSTRILLADDHTLMRQGLRHILESRSEFNIVAEASSGIEAVEAARHHKPDVAIIDVAMKEMNGIEATTQILKHSPATAVRAPCGQSRRPGISAQEFGRRGADPGDPCRRKGPGILQPRGG